MKDVELRSLLAMIEDVWLFLRYPGCKERAAQPGRIQKIRRIL